MGGLEPFRSPWREKKTKPNVPIAALKKNSPEGDFFFKEKKRLWLWIFADFAREICQIAGARWQISRVKSGRWQILRVESARIDNENRAFLIGILAIYAFTGGVPGGSRGGYRKPCTSYTPISGQFWEIPKFKETEAWRKCAFPIGKWTIGSFFVDLRRSGKKCENQ